MTLPLLAFAGLLVNPAVADSTRLGSPDLVREQRLRQEIVDIILEGEPLELRAMDGTRFLGIYTEASAGPARGTVVILPGRGLHPDWVDVVQPLRVGLAEHGWNTLSIQLPVLGKEAKYFDYLSIFGAAMPRIEAAISEARERSSGPVVLLAHSCGAHMAQHWINHAGNEATVRIDAFVGIGMGATDYGQPMREPFALDRLSVPVLDIYGEDDFPAVRRLAGVRLEALMRSGNPKSAQIVVPGAEHYFRDRGRDLLEAISDWLGGL